MKTKPIPAVIALIAGFVTCLVAFFKQLSMTRFSITLLLVVVFFYIFGCIIKVVLDKNFLPKAEITAINEESEQNDQEKQEESKDSETQDE